MKHELWMGLTSSEISSTGPCLRRPGRPAAEAHFAIKISCWEGVVNSDLWCEFGSGWGLEKQCIGQWVFPSDKGGAQLWGQKRGSRLSPRSSGLPTRLWEHYCLFLHIKREANQWNTALISMGNSLHFSTLTHKAVQPEMKKESHGHRKVPEHSHWKGLRPPVNWTWGLSIPIWPL